MKKKFLITSILLGISLHAVYAANPSRPEACPSPDAIRSVGVSRNTVVDGNLWFTGRRHQDYGTANAWTFILGMIPAVNANDAYNKAVIGLQSLSLPVGPIEGPPEKWVCLYSTLQGYLGVTITAPIALNEASRYLR